MYTEHFSKWAVHGASCGFGIGGMFDVPNVPINEKLSSVTVKVNCKT